MGNNNSVSSPKSDDKDKSFSLYPFNDHMENRQQTESPIDVMFQSSQPKNNHENNLESLILTEISATSDFPVNNNIKYSQTSHLNNQNFTGVNFISEESAINVEFTNANLYGGADNISLSESSVDIDTENFKQQLGGGENNTESEFDSAKLLNIITQLGGAAESDEENKNTSETISEKTPPKKKRRNVSSSSSYSLSSDSLSSDSYIMDEDDKKAKKYNSPRIVSDTELSASDINLLSFSEPMNWVSERS